MNNYQANLPPGIIDKLVREANEEAPKEACGFIVRERIGVNEHRILLKRCDNVAKNPEHHFEFDAQQLLLLYEQYESVGNLIGMYHSHPHGPDTPSEADYKYAPPNGLRYFVVTLTHVYEYNMMEQRS